jgi:hypothetical protein
MRLGRVCDCCNTEGCWPPGRNAQIEFEVLEECWMPKTSHAINMLIATHVTRQCRTTLNAMVTCVDAV